MGRCFTRQILERRPLVQPQLILRIDVNRILGKVGITNPEKRSRERREDEGHDDHERRQSDDVVPVLHGTGPDEEVATNWVSLRYGLEIVIP
jgi:hypothetical protein